MDASVVMSWCFEDEANRYTDGVLGSLEKSEAIVPAIWPLEIGNVLVVAERGKRLTEADSARFLSLLGELPIRIEQETRERMMGEVLAAAREFGISTYDASYLDLAMRQGLPIATKDAGLRKAAKRARVEIFRAG